MSALFDSLTALLSFFDRLKSSPYASAFLWLLLGIGMLLLTKGKEKQLRRVCLGALLAVCAGFITQSLLAGEEAGAVPLDAVADEAPYWVVTQHASPSGNQAVIYTLCNLQDGTLLVIDGGWDADTEYVRNTIRNYGGTVDAWFLTHYHQDHINAFNQIYADPQDINIKQVYISEPDPDVLIPTFRYWDDPESFATFQEITAGAENVQPLQMGDALSFPGLDIQVLNAYRPEIVENTKDLSNDLSLVLKISGANKSMLLLSDARGEWLEQDLLDRWGETLQADYVQCGHHGNNAFSKEFYDFVHPEVALFDAPLWLLTGESYKAKDLYTYFEEKGITIWDYRTAPNVFVLS